MVIASKASALIIKRLRPSDDFLDSDPHWVGNLLEELSGTRHLLQYVHLHEYITPTLLAIVGGSFLLFWKHPFLLFWSANLPDPYKRIIASAAMYVVLSIVPAFMIDIGFGTHLHISASEIANPILGIILGPIMGAVLAAIGGVIGVMINPVSATVGYGTEYMLLSKVKEAFTGRRRKCKIFTSTILSIFAISYPPSVD